MVNGRRNECPPRTEPYVIQRGDTLGRLARRFDVTVSAIVTANPFLDPENLSVGQEICMPLQAPFPPCPERNFYTIRPGDTLSSIARRFNVSLDDLREANPLLDPQQLRVGDVICLPVAVPPVDCPPGTREYTITRGDTFYSLARRFNTTVDRLRDLNPDVNPGRLLLGQQICVPAEDGRCPIDTREYTIQRGDNLFQLARRFNTTVNRLRRLNPGIEPERLAPGQVICVPAR
jgi:LysM repeat protein